MTSEQRKVVKTHENFGGVVVSTIATDFPTGDESEPVIVTVRMPDGSEFEIWPDGKGTF